MKILHLNLKGEYFDTIKNGNKPFEYRLKNEYWTKKLMGRDYDEVHFKSGYPRNDELDKIIKIPYRGYEIHKIIHKHFSNEPVEVFAIHTSSESRT